MHIPPSLPTRRHQAQPSEDAALSKTNPADSNSGTKAPSDDFSFYYVNDRNKLDRIALETILTQADKINADF